jgi:peptidylamidoglycolate lyase
MGGIVKLSRRSLLFLSIGILFTATAALRILAQGGKKGGEEVFGPYEVVASWPKPLSTELTWGRTSSVFAESPDRVFVLQSGMVPWSWKKLQGERLLGSQQSGGTDYFIANGAMHCASTLGFDQKWHCQTSPDGKLIDALVERDGKPIPGAKWENIIMVFDHNGNLLENWDQWKHLFGHPHTITENPYDPEHHVWVVDAGSDQVFEFSNDGKKLVMTVGESRVQGNDKTHLNGPNGIAFLPNGDFYVTDGYKNFRVVKFSRDGKYLLEWGKKGKGPGEFDIPHGLAIDSAGHIYVNDRSNSRIQVFDLQGKFLEEWKDIRFPQAIAISKDGKYLWIGDGYNNKILKYDVHGVLIDSWGTFGVQPGDIWGVHSLGVDSQGNVYTGEVFGGRSQKFTPQPGADPKRLMGQLQ